MNSVQRPKPIYDSRLAGLRLIIVGLLLCIIINAFIANQLKTRAEKADQMLLGLAQSYEACRQQVVKACQARDTAAHHDACEVPYGR